MNITIMKSTIEEATEVDSNYNLIDLKLKHETGFVSNIRMPYGIYRKMKLKTGSQVESIHFRNYLEGIRAENGLTYLQKFWD